MTRIRRDRAALLSKASWGKAVLTAALLAAALATNALQETTPREERWREDLEFFARQFPAVETDFDKLFPPEGFRQDVGALEHDLAQLPDSEVVLRLMRVVAAAGVSHTTIRSPGGDTRVSPLSFKICLVF
jgi:hypothetical protein